MAVTVLLIESDDASITSLRDAFRSTGAEVLVERDGDAGVAVAEAQRPDLIVLSVELGRTSGYTICKRLKRSEVIPNVPVFLLSATATPEIFEKHRELKTRAEEYFTKPVDMGELLDAARRYVDFGSSSSLASPRSDADELADALDGLLDSGELDSLGGSSLLDEGELDDLDLGDILKDEQAQATVVARVSSPPPRPAEAAAAARAPAVRTSAALIEEGELDDLDLGDLLDDEQGQATTVAAAPATPMRPARPNPEYRPAAIDEIDANAQTVLPGQARRSDATPVSQPAINVQRTPSAITAIGEARTTETSSPRIDPHGSLSTPERPAVANSRPFASRSIRPRSASSV